MNMELLEKARLGALSVVGIDEAGKGEEPVKYLRQAVEIVRANFGVRGVSGGFSARRTEPDFDLGA